MSIVYKSPMPKKFQAFFLFWAVAIMACFALVGISIPVSWGRAMTFLVIALLMVGFGFMLRKRVLRKLGMPQD